MRKVVDPLLSRGLCTLMSVTAEFGRPATQGTVRIWLSGGHPKGRLKEERWAGEGGDHLDHPLGPWEESADGSPQRMGELKNPGEQRCLIVNSQLLGDPLHSLQGLGAAQDRHSTLMAG